MMGNADDLKHNGQQGQRPPGWQQQHHHHQQQTKATFSGMTALTAVVALLLAIISAAVPHWGYYKPIGSQYFQQGFSTQDNRGHFGPFQVCKNTARAYTYCGGQTVFQATTWLQIAGALSIILVISLAGVALFSVLHVAMQLQRREIMVTFQRAVFLKLVLSCVSALVSVLAAVFGGLEFRLHTRTSSLRLDMGVCFYLQIVLIFVDLILIFLSYLSYKRAKSHPPHMVPRNRDPSMAYEAQNGNGISMTLESGMPYRHGQPRPPVHPHPYSPPGSTVSSYVNNGSSAGSPINYQFSADPNATIQMPQQAVPQAPNAYSFLEQQQQQQQQMQIQQQQQAAAAAAAAAAAIANGGGFTPVTLVAAPSTSTSPPVVVTAAPTVLRPIQPVQPIQLPPQSSSGGNGSAGGGGRLHIGGVSLIPDGRKQVNVAGAGAHGGSTESLNSTQSLTLSNLSFGSTTSTGSHPLRSSLKKPKNKDVASVSSKTSSKQVRISLGQEQTAL